MYYNGLYHLFYQYNPKGSVWGNIVWAHSVSTDLINWVKLPNAIYPSKHFDIQGCWSGSATILPGNHPFILYTGINNEGLQVQNYAVPSNESDPYLIEWHKPDNNPVIYPEIDVNETAFRDPTTAWFEGGHWKTLVSSRRNHRGIIYLYRSRDFVHWTKAKHPFYDIAMSDMLECPDFFPVSKLSRKGVETSSTGEGLKHILKISLDNAKFDYYFIGTYFPHSDKFVLDNPELNEWSAPRFDYGKYYASKTFFDSNKNRRILWGWANETDPAEVDERKGWAGIHAIPRMLWLDMEGKQLRQRPIMELNQLRMREVQIRDVVLEQGKNIEIKGITAAQADVDVVFSFSNLDMAEQFDDSWGSPQSICSQKGASVSSGVGPFGLMTLASQNMEEYTPIFFIVFKTNTSLHRVVMCSDARSSSLGEEFYKPTYGSFIDIDMSDGKLSLRTLIDHSVVESFGAGGRSCILSRVYPTLAVFNNARLLAFNNGIEPIDIMKLSAWSMRNAKINI